MTTAQPPRHLPQRLTLDEQAEAAAAAAPPLTDRMRADLRALFEQRSSLRPGARPGVHDTQKIS